MSKFACAHSLCLRTSARKAASSFLGGIVKGPATKPAHGHDDAGQAVATLTRQANAALVRRSRRRGSRRYPRRNALGNRLGLVQRQRTIVGVVVVAAVLIIIIIRDYQVVVMVVVKVCVNRDSMNPPSIVNPQYSITKGMVTTLRRWTSLCR